jgi:threonine aldolase
MNFVYILIIFGNIHPQGCLEGFIKEREFDAYMSTNNSFASDNHSGVHPAILKAIIAANNGYVIAYGDDDYTAHAVKKVKDHFGKDSIVYFVYNGTAANIIGIKAVTHSYHAVICADTAHLHVHECGGPEKFTGCKVLTIPTTDGKLTCEQIEPLLVGFGDCHRAQPKVVSITQPTELGTVYTPKELTTLTDFAHQHNLLVHMDGARLCNAAASLQTPLRSISRDVGIDILSFGGTKNGMMFGEAVIFFDPTLATDFPYIRKQGMQLASKMRFISAQFQAFLTHELWLKNAQHANFMANELYTQVKDIPLVQISQNVETNAVFASIPRQSIEMLLKYYFFHIFDEQKLIARWMCSFNTTKKEVHEFATKIQQILSAVKHK